MRNALLLVLPILLLTASTARAEDRVGFLDADRAIRECADGKKAIADTKAATQAREKERADRDAAVLEAKKAKKPAPAPLMLTDEQWQSQQVQREQGVSNGVFVRIKRILPAVRKARKLTSIAPMPFDVDPDRDVTAEVIKRLDAGEGRDAVAVAADEAAKLKAENAKLRAELAAKASKKPAPTSALPNLDPRALTATRPTP